MANWLEEEEHRRSAWSLGVLKTKRIVIRKACSLQDLSEWREDQILNAIQWMMLESQAIKDSIPGREIMTEGATVEDQLASRLRVVMRGTQFMTEEAAAKADADEILQNAERLRWR